MNYNFFLSIFLISSFFNINSSYNGKAQIAYYYSLKTGKLEKKPAAKLFENLQRKYLEELIDSDDRAFLSDMNQFIYQCESCGIRYEEDCSKVEKEIDRLFQQNAAKARAQNNLVVAPVVQNSDSFCCPSFFSRRPQIHPEQANY